MSPRRSTSAVFLVHAAIAGTLAPRIPAIKANLGLGDGQLGVALTGFAAGLFLGTRVAAWLVDRFGSRRVVQVGLPLFAVCLAGPALAGGLATLTIAFVPLGIAAGLVDVAMNEQAVRGRARARAGRSCRVPRVLERGLLASSGIAVRPRRRGRRASARTCVVAAAATHGPGPARAARPASRDRRRARASSTARADRADGHRARRDRLLLVPRRGRGRGLERRLPARGCGLERGPRRVRVHRVRRSEWCSRRFCADSALRALRPGTVVRAGGVLAGLGADRRPRHRGGAGGSGRVRPTRPRPRADRPHRLQRRGERRQAARGRSAGW